MDQASFEVLVAMPERSVFLVLTPGLILRTILGLIFLHMVETFNFVVTNRARVALTAVALSRAQIWRVVTRGPSTAVNLGVVEATVLVVMLMTYLALLDFELS